MSAFRLLRRARRDLLDIADFTADRWGEEQAEHYVTQLFVGFQKLVDLPALRRPYPDLPPYCRVLVGKHAVFYRVVEGDDILIVRVLHAVMLPELHLSGDEDDEQVDGAP